MFKFRMDSLILLLVILPFHSVGQDTIQGNLAQLEALFLKENLELLSVHIAIDKAEAEMIQAKIWPNPVLTVEEVNLWRPKSIQGEELAPPLVGNFGRNQQFVVQLEQGILTGKKRERLIELKRLEIEDSRLYFEAFLKELKFNFRTIFYELHYLQTYQKIYQKQWEVIETLLSAYNRQVESGFIDKTEYIRLKAYVLNIRKEIDELDKEIEEKLGQLNYYLNLPKPTYLKCEIKELSKPVNFEFSTAMISERMFANNPEQQRKVLKEKIAHQLLKLEKANRTPDLSINLGYNRADGIYQDYVGFGFSIGLPLFNRNKGNIRRAELQIDESKLNRENVELMLSKQLQTILNNYQREIDFYNAIESDLAEDLDSTIEVYTTNFKLRRISLLEFIDFLNTYIETSELILNAELNLRRTAEIINYQVGEDLIQFD